MQRVSCELESHAALPAPWLRECSCVVIRPELYRQTGCTVHCPCWVWKIFYTMHGCRTASPDGTAALTVGWGSHGQWGRGFELANLISAHRHATPPRSSIAVAVLASCYLCTLCLPLIQAPHRRLCAASVPSSGEGGAHGPAEELEERWDS